MNASRPRASLAAILRQLSPPALMAALFTAVGVLHVASRVKVVDAGYRLSRLHAEGQRLALENDRLKVELATLQSPARLEKLAREQLGMSPVSASAVVNVPSPSAKKAPDLKLAERLR